jgi:hypothetical protein
VNVNWKTVHEAANLFAVVAGLFGAIRKSSLSKSASVRDDGTVVFSPDWLIYVELPVVLIPPALASYAAVHHGVQSTTDLLGSAVICFAALAYIFSLPGTILATWEGLEQLYWLRPEKRIRWDEIVEIKASGNTGALTIKKADGTTIVHNARLADREGLLEEIRKHCGSNLPPGFPSGKPKRILS